MQQLTLEYCGCLSTNLLSGTKLSSLLCSENQKLNSSRFCASMMAHCGPTLAVVSPVVAYHAMAAHMLMARKLTIKYHRNHSLYMGVSSQSMSTCKQQQSVGVYLQRTHFIRFHGLPA